MNMVNLDLKNTISYVDRPGHIIKFSGGNEKENPREQQAPCFPPRDLLRLFTIHYDLLRFVVYDTHLNQMFQMESTNHILLQKLEEQFPEFAFDDSPTKRVGGEITKDFTTVKHKYRMLSLGNSCFS